MQAEDGTFISDFANIPTPPNLILSTYENITRRLQRQKSLKYSTWNGDPKEHSCMYVKYVRQTEA